MNALKRFPLFLLALVMCISMFAMTAWAASTSQDGLEITLTTDKKDYAQGEQITATLTVKNTNDFAVTNVSLEQLVPDGYKLPDSSPTTKQAESLGAGETVTLAITYTSAAIPVSNDDKGDNGSANNDGETSGSTTDNNNETNADATDSGTENNASADNGNGTSNGGSANTNVTSPKTGDETNIVVSLMLFLLSIALIIFIVLKTKKGKQFLSLFLCFALFGTLVFPNVAQAASEQYKSCGIETVVKVNDVDVKISAKVTYSIIDADEQNNVTVTFYLNYEDAGVYQTTPVHSGDKVYRPTDPIRNGYTFGGWYTDAATTTAYNFGSAIMSNLSLYAKWEEVSPATDYYMNNAELLEIISVNESDDVLTETEARSFLTGKGFGENQISYDYSIAGNRVDDTEVANGSTNVHPMYQTLYMSQSGEAWAIYVINGAIFANPVSFNLESDLGAMLLISESETLTSYDDETNQFYITIPHMSEAILHTVAKIDSETLDGLTIEEICRLTGATVSDDDSDIYSSDSAMALTFDAPYALASVSADARYSSEDPLIVVSLGDSYSSGESIEEFYGQNKDLNDKVRDDNWLAHRSMRGWPALLKVPGMSGTTSDHMVPLGTTSTSDYQWYFAAASGATTWHFQNSFQKDYHRSTGWFSAVEGSKDLPRQLDAFNGLYGDVDYVTLSIGGNDVGFADVVTTCAVNCAYLHFGATSKLEDQLNDTWAGFSTTRANIKKAYEDIQAAAGSQAAIIVAGYPQLLEPNGKGFVINKKEAQLVDSNVSRFNDEIESIVNECRQAGMNIYFVDVESAFTGHLAYSDSPWINKIIFSKKEQDLSDKGVGSAYSVHPNAQGAQAYARLVNATIEEIENSKSNQVSNITGVVTIADTDTDMNNNLPLEGATVMIEYASSMDFVATSDARGQYQIENVPAGTYRLTVTKEGYIPVTERIIVPEDGSEVIYNVAIEAISEGYSGIGHASGMVYDVSTGIGIPGLTLNIYRGIGVTTGDVTLTTSTTDGGWYETQDGIEAGNYTVVVVDERSGISDELRYTTATFNIKVLGGMTIDNQNGYVSNGITSDNIRVVLSWGSMPSDLDSHLVGPTSAGGAFHVYYSNDTYGSEVDLDRDDTDSYGPETITIRSINDGIYTYAVHNYSDRGSSSSMSLSTSGAQVQVYRGAELVMTYNVPTGMDGTLWTVFSYDTNTQQFSTINSISYDSSNGEGVLQGTAYAALNLDSENAVIGIAQDMIMSDVSANAKQP